MFFYDRLINYYDNSFLQRKISPVAHTKLNANIAVLIDATGFKMAAEIKERVAVPCTIESETRTSGVAPHLIHDNLSYVGNLNGYDERWRAYMTQLENYVYFTHDPVAKAVYDYLYNNNLLSDIGPVLDKIKLPPERLNVVFSVYPMKDTINLHWTKHYVNSLPQNGLCSLTGLLDHIPKAYPSSIRYPGDMAKLFVSNPNALNSMSSKGIMPGYIASQKVIHTLQVLCQGNEDEVRSETAKKELKNYCVKDIDV